MRGRAFLLTVLLGVSGVGAETDTGWKFLVPEEYNVGDMTTHPGNGWLALVGRHGVWQLEPATVRTRRDTRPAEDESSHGLVVSSSVKGTIALFRMPDIRVGKGSAAQMNFHNPVGLGNGGTIAIPFGGSVYKVESVEDGLGEPSVYLRKGTRRALLTGVHTNGCFAIDLIWAGDLNGDGRLDLIMADGAGISLFLSGGGSTAGPLVRLAAVYRRYIDC